MAAADSRVRLGLRESVSEDRSRASLHHQCLLMADGGHHVRYVYSLFCHSQDIGYFYLSVLRYSLGFSRRRCQYCRRVFFSRIARHDPAWHCGSFFFASCGTHLFIEHGIAARKDVIRRNHRHHYHCDRIGAFGIIERLKIENSPFAGYFYANSSHPSVVAGSSSRFLTGYPVYGAHYSWYIA